MPKQNQPKEEKREKGTAQAVIREILSWVIPFVIALAVAMFLKNYIIINAEGIGDSINMAKRIEEATGMETRATILGHMQRGGSPTCKDRVYASIMGSMAVDLLLQGKTNRVVGYKDGQFVDFDIEEALAMKKTVSDYQYDVAKILAL